MESKTILFTVDGDNISPRTEQKAGVQGNHNITEVRFNVEETLVSGALGDPPTSRIRMQFIDGAGGFYSTGFLDVMSEILPDESAQYYVTCPIPNNVTNAGGLAYVYLVVTEIDYGDGKALENQVYISPPGKLLYTHSGVGSPSEYAYKVGITNALVNAEIFAGQAERYSNEAKSAEYNSAKSESAAATSAAAALTSENNAKGFESAAAESATKARKSENSASTDANKAKTSETNAKTYATNAMTSATNARLSANAAENSATAARQDSDLAKEYRDETADMFENFNGIQLWQPNTEYKFGDIVLGTVLYKGEIDIPVQALLKCNQDHISSNESESITDYNIYKRWDLLKKLTTEVSVKAIMDDNANIITNTYATKEELAEAIGQALEGDY